MEEVTYLQASYAQRQAVKALGARWDGERRSWYVPAGRDLAPFAPWLPAERAADFADSRAPAAGTDLALPARRGIPLSRLLAGVARAVAEAYAEGVWTIVEVVEARLQGGHVWLDVSERTPSGEVTAKARAVVWAATAARILPPFEQATGARIGPGIKLLLRLRPVFKAQHGFSLEVDAIDPDYTLGDLEARRREIRERLRREGLFDANRRLPPPWDYEAVLVVAPESAAGLGDFRAEADRLERAGICRFVYASSRFQGEGAAAEIRRTLLEALARWSESVAALPDAIVLIRGGGSANDLAWLDDYELARAVCEAPVPVLTGIGHERDGTVVDEVAQQKFDTPSKVILGIEQAIQRRVRQAAEHFRGVTALAGDALRSRRAAVDAAGATVKSAAQRQLADAARTADANLARVRVGAMKAVRAAAADARGADALVRQAARQQVAGAKTALPALLAEVRTEARAAVRSAQAESASRLASVVARAGADAALMKESSARAIAAVAAESRRAGRDGAATSRALIREITGQGPEKTLARGFATVHAADGRTVTSAARARDERRLHIRFHDGSVAADTRHDEPSTE